MKFSCWDLFWALFVIGALVWYFQELEHKKEMQKILPPEREVARGGYLQFNPEEPGECMEQAYVETEKGFRLYWEDGNGDPVMRKKEGCGN
jgi:hypothetical protein